MRFWNIRRSLLTALWCGRRCMLGRQRPARPTSSSRSTKPTQRMSVSVDGQPRYTWAVSTGVHGTPSGTFRPQSLSRNHRSSLFNNAPMPYSIFYDGNYAIHGTNQISRLGGRASKGCVRLHPVERRGAVRAGAAGRPRQHPDPHPVAASRSRDPTVRLRIDGQVSAPRAVCGSPRPCGPSANAPPPSVAPRRGRPAVRLCAMTRD